MYKTIHIQDYEQFVGAETIDRIKEKALPLQGLHITNVNSTYYGGASHGEDFFKVSVGDMDRNGRDEVCLVSSYGHRVRSTVLEWTGGLKRLYRRKGHMRVVRDADGDQPLLLFQDSKVDKFFSGKIRVMDYGKGETPVQKEPLIEFENVQFYTLMPLDLNGDGVAEFLGLGKESSIFHVWDKKGTILWADDQKIGGTNNYVSTGEPSDLIRPEPKVFINSRLLLTDIDGDNKKEILAIKNIPVVDFLLNWKVYNESNLTAYSIEGTSLVPTWKTRKIKYCLTDMQERDGTLFIAAHKGKVSNIGKESGLVMWFE